MVTVAVVTWFVERLVDITDVLVVEKVVDKTEVSKDITVETLTLDDKTVDKVGDTVLDVKVEVNAVDDILDCNVIVCDVVWDTGDDVTILDGVNDDDVVGCIDDVDTDDTDDGDTVVDWFNGTEGFGTPEKQHKNFSLKLLIHVFSYPLFLAYVLGAQKNLLIETVLLSTHNICFGWEIRKLIFSYALLSKGLQTKYFSLKL